VASAGLHYLTRLASPDVSRHTVSTCATRVATHCRTATRSAASATPVPKIATRCIFSNSARFSSALFAPGAVR
jgi:hypothetical protein